jgi:small-conductance mechanosensitive channel
MEKFAELIDKLSKMSNKGIMGKELFKMGETPVTLTVIIELVLIIIVFFVGSKFLGRFLRKRVLPRFHIDAGAQYNIVRLLHYTILVLGILFALNVVGIQLTSLAVIFGLIGVGIAFGLQNITSNFVSGIILLFERPVSVGDYIQVGDTSGEVQSINVRSTTVITLDNITLIVPNSRFVEDTVTNWSVGDPKIRLSIPVGVAYGSDTELVTQILLKVAEDHPKAISNPEPDVLFREFGDSSLNFELRVWIIDPLGRLKIISELNYAIDKAFRENGVTIPFPQRDVHFFREA